MNRFAGTKRNRSDDYDKPEHLAAPIELAALPTIIYEHILDHPGTCGDLLLAAAGSDPAG